MDAVKFLKTVNRMCSTFENCDDCPIQKLSYACGSLKGEEQEMVSKVEEWEEEHPEKTRLSEFLKMYPKVYLKLDLKSGRYFPDFCINSFDKDHGCTGNCSDCKEKFWNEEVE